MDTIDANIESVSDREGVAPSTVADSPRHWAPSPTRTAARAARWAAPSRPAHDSASEGVR